MFDTHLLNEKGLTEVKIFKETISRAYREIDFLLGDNREASLFKTKLEEAMFFGTKAIASKPTNFTEIVKY